MATNNAINQKDPHSIFFAYPSANILNISGDGTVYGPIAFNTELYDLSSDYNSGTYIFTAPSTDKFYLQANVKIGGITANHTKATLSIITTARTFVEYDINAAACQTAANELSLYADCIVDMTATDTAYVSLYVSATDLTIDILTNGATDPLSWFAGYLIR